MTTQKDLQLDKEYIYIGRVIARIAIANDDIDDQERKMIASTIAKYTNLGEEAINLLIEDVSKKPDVIELVSEITSSENLKRLILELIIFGFMKEVWSDTEIKVFNDAISSVRISEKDRNKLCQGIELLKSIKFK